MAGWVRGGGDWALRGWMECCLFDWEVGLSGVGGLALAVNEVILCCELEGSCSRARGDGDTVRTTRGRREKKWRRSDVTPTRTLQHEPSLCDARKGRL